MRLVRYNYPSFRSLAPALGGQLFSPLSSLGAGVDRWLEAALTDAEGNTPSAHCPVNLYEDKDNTYVRAELPGVNREDLNVEFGDGHLTITAVRKATAADGKAGESVSFRRSVGIANETQADKVTAAYENGMLTVTLPKREEAKPRKIAVN